MWEESVGDWGPGLLDALSEIEDPRKPKGVRHPLPAVLALSVCAMLSGARSLYAIASGAGNIPSWPSLWGSAGNRNDGLTLSDREWECGGCGKWNKRDYNAALNLERWPGLSFPVSGRGDRVRPAVPAVVGEASSGFVT